MGEPILKANYTWFNNSYGITRTSITEIELKDTYTPTGTEGTDYYTWDASANNDGSVRVYIEGTKCIIAGNGSGKIYANKDSFGLFSNPSYPEGRFASLASIDNLGMLDTSKATNMSWMFADCSSLTSLDTSSFDTSKVTTMHLMFYDCQSLTFIDVSGFDTSQVTDMTGMFEHCDNLTSLNVSNFNTAKVTTMGDMFSYCKSLTSLDLGNFNTANVTSMSQMFLECVALDFLDISSFDTSKVTTMRRMFYYCQSLVSLDLSGFNTSNVTNMSQMFRQCESLTSLNLNNFNTSNVTDMYGMFTNCKKLSSLNVSNFNTSKIDNMSWMFSGCYVLTSLDVSSFDTSQVTNMMGMFQECLSIGSLDLSSFNTSKVTDMTQMFLLCNKLSTIYASPRFVTTSVTNSSYMFDSCSVLTGGNGTKCISSRADATYARIDTPETPGYFTLYIPPILAPSDTWFTKGNSGILRSSLTEIEIVDTYTPTGSETASWDASEANDGSVMVYVEGTKLTIAGNKSGKVFANPDASYMFADPAKADYYLNLTKIDGIGLLDTSRVTNMQAMFRSIIKVTELDLNHFNTSNVTNMRYVFGSYSAQGNMALKTLNVSNWDTSKVESIRTMFQSCASLTSLDLSGWDVSNVTDCSYMFWGCTKLATIGNTYNWNLSASTSFLNMFYNCSALKEIDTSNWGLSKTTTISNMFYNCSALMSIGDTSKWDTGACTDMSTTFFHCTSLKQLNVSNWDVSKVTTFNRMFTSDNYGELGFSAQLDTTKWNTSSAKDLGFMFYGYKGSPVLDVSNFNTSKVTNLALMFAFSSAIIVGYEDWDTSSITNLQGIFLGTKNTSLNISKFTTSKVKSFGSMFSQCSELVEIIGLENFNTSSGINFASMFKDSPNIKELNLHSFNTAKANVGVSVADNGAKSECTQDMFAGMTSLQKITLGPKFTFQGDGTADPSYHGTLPETADGNWYKRDRSAYAYNEIPNNTAATYYSGLDVVEELFYKKMLVKNGTLLDIADAVRAATGETSGLKLGDMPEKIGEIFEAGRKSEYDEFWDAYQDKGAVKPYSFAFAESYWTEDRIKPKYDIKPTSAYMMFMYNGNPVDFLGICERQGVVFDGSQCTSYQYTFSHCAVTRIGRLDFTKCKHVSQTFQGNTSLYHISAFVSHKDLQFFTHSFDRCSSLTHMLVEGVIGQNGLDLHWSPLDNPSLTSIINALSTETSGLAATLSLSAVNNAFETSPGLADGSTSPEWLALVNTKTNWTISLV